MPLLGFCICLSEMFDSALSLGLKVHLFCIFLLVLLCIFFWNDYTLLLVFFVLVLFDIAARLIRQVIFVCFFCLGCLLSQICYCLVFLLQVFLRFLLLLFRSSPTYSICFLISFISSCILTPEVSISSFIAPGSTFTLYALHIAFSLFSICIGFCSSNSCIVPPKFLYFFCYF